MFGEPPYRTASAATIKAQTRQIIAKANANMQAAITVKSECPYPDKCGQGRKCACKPSTATADRADNCTAPPAA
jgi:hypothetical protein